MSYSCCSIGKSSVMLIAFLFTIFLNILFLSDSFRICDKLSSYRISFKKSQELHSSLLTKNTFQVGNQSFNLYQQQSEAKYLAFDDFPEGNKFAALDSSRQKPSLLTLEELKSKFVSINKDKKISFKGGFPFLRLAMPLVILKDTHVVLVDQNNELTKGAESQEIYVTEQELKRAWAESSSAPMGKRTELFSIEESLLLIPDEDDDDILTDYESSGLLATEGIAIPSDPTIAVSEAEIFITSEELERIWNEQSNIPLSLPQKSFDIQSSLLLLDTDDDDVEYETRLRIIVNDEEEEEIEDIDQRIWEYEEMGGEDLEEVDIQGGDIIVDEVTIVKPTEYVDANSNIWTEKEKDTYWKNYGKHHSPEEAEILQKLQEELDDRSDNRNAWKKRDNFLTPDIETQSFFGDINNGNIYLTQRIPAKWVDFEEEGMTDGYKSTGTMAWPGQNETDYNKIIKPWERLDLPVRQMLELELEDLKEQLPDVKKKLKVGMTTTTTSGDGSNINPDSDGDSNSDSDDKDNEIVIVEEELVEDDEEMDFNDYDENYETDYGESSDYDDDDDPYKEAYFDDSYEEEVNDPGLEEEVNEIDTTTEAAFQELYEDDNYDDEHYEDDEEEADEDFDYDDINLDDYDEEDIDTLLEAVLSDLKDMTGNNADLKGEEVVAKKEGKKKRGDKVVENKEEEDDEVEKTEEVNGGESKSLEEDDQIFDMERWGGKEGIEEDEEKGRTPTTTSTSTDEIDWSEYDLSPTVGLTNDVIEPLAKADDFLENDVDSSIEDLLMGGSNQRSDQIDVESFFRSMNLDGDVGGEDDSEIRRYQDDNIEDSEKYITEYVDTMRASRKQPVPWTTPREWINKPEFADHVGIEEWGSYNYITKDDMWNDDDIMTAIAIDHVMEVTDTYLFDHSKYSRKIDNARYWERKVDNLITGKDDIKEPIPPHLTPDKDRGVEYSDEIIEMKGKISLLPYYPPPEIRWADNVFTPNEDLSPLSMIGTVRSQFEWTPRGDEAEWVIEPEVVEKIQPVLDLCNHIAKLKSTKGNVLVFQYDGTMRHIVGIHAMMLETAKVCFPEIVELRLETVRESDHHDI